MNCSGLRSIHCIDFCVINVSCYQYLYLTHTCVEAIVKRHTPIKTVGQLLRKLSKILPCCSTWMKIQVKCILWHQKIQNTTTSWILWRMYMRLFICALYHCKSECRFPSRTVEEDLRCSDGVGRVTERQRDQHIFISLCCSWMFSLSWLL